MELFDDDIRKMTPSHLNAQLQSHVLKCEDYLLILTNTSVIGTAPGAGILIPAAISNSLFVFLIIPGGEPQKRRPKADKIYIEFSAVHQKNTVALSEAEYFMFTCAVNVADKLPCGQYFVLRGI